MTELISLVAELRVDQQARWQLGDRVQVESYLILHPPLRRDPDAVLDLIWHELVLRQEQGDPPQLAEYLRRFSQFAERIRALFHMLHELEQAPRTQVGRFPPLQAPASLDPGSYESSLDLPAVPGYDIVAELGRGGMGVVYKARQRSLRRMVALKMILSGAYADATARTRFRTEAEAVARLQHPNIVQIHEVGEHDGRPFLSLEYVDGIGLKQKVAGRAQPERQAAQLVETIARAVHYTHQRGILHRDLNPNNVLLTSDGTPKVTDFGLAKLLDAEAGPTRTEMLIGTPCYMSPEQAWGNTKQIGVPADVYSLGAILYELLTGRPPFQGDTVLNTLEQVRTQDPVPLRRLRLPVSRDLETICLKCLEKEPAKRYASAEALADDLRRFLEGESIQARPVAVVRKLWRSARRRPTLVASVVGAAALLCLALTAWSYFRATTQLAAHRAEAKYQQFLQRRNDALFYGLLSADQGALFLGEEAAANLKAAESAAREALALAGIDADSESAAVDASLPAARKADVAADCYALLLVLASVRGEQALGHQGDKKPYQEALRILEQARQLGFQTRAYHLRRANFLDRLGEQAEAKKERDQAASLPLDGALDYFLLGEDQYRRGDWDGAANSFNRTLAVQPGHFWSQFFLAVCHLRTQHWEAAKAGLNACLTQHPDFVWAYLFRSFANERLQALAESEADFQKALQLNPNEDARYVLFLTRGILHFNQGQLDLAATDFRAAMDLKPDQYNAYLNVAQVYLAQGQFDQAEEQMSRAMRLRPPVQVVVAYHVERGRNLLRNKRYVDAVTACDAALQLSPDQPLPYEVRARALLSLGRFGAAEQSFDEYLRNGGAEGADVYRGRGLARMKLGKYPEALEDYTRALERAPDADIYQHRGWAHFFNEAYKLALRDFSIAIEMDTEAGDAYTGRGLAQVMLGHYREAVADAKTALRHDPATPEMMHNIACTFALALALADRNRSQEGWQALVESYRNHALEAVEQTLEMLRPEERSRFWQDKIVPDTALDSIRDDAGFKALFDKYVKPR